MKQPPSRGQMGPYEKQALTRRVVLFMIMALGVCSLVTAVLLVLSAANGGQFMPFSSLTGTTLLGNQPGTTSTNLPDTPAAELDVVLLTDQQSDKGLLRKPCADGCERNGNCNYEEGRCECPFGYTGPTCASALFPACKLAFNASEMHCGEHMPRSCQCLRQCREFFCPPGKRCEAPRDPWYVRCFEHKADLARMKKGNLSYEVQNPKPGEAPMVYSDIPELTSEKDIVWYRGIRADMDRQVLKRDQAVIIQGLDPAEDVVYTVLPVAKCPHRCSFRGTCVQRDGAGISCACWQGYTGLGCKQVRPTACMNQCSRRGVCRGGFCLCNKGWWGKDCSRSKAFPPHSALSSAHKLKIYVYELPSHVAFEFEKYVGWQGYDPIYMAYKAFYTLLLNDWATRTENPWEANMFFVPALSYAYSSNLGDVVEHLHRVMTYVRTTHPFYDRSGGSNHFFWLPNDLGACWIAPDDGLLARVIKVVHFGFHQYDTKLPGDFQLMPRKGFGCFHPQRDVLAAPYYPAQEVTARKTYSNYSAERIPNERLLFFAGDIRTKHLDYSGGVRQELWELYKRGKLGPEVTVMEKMPRPSEYERLVATSKFCFAPYGHGWGIRLSRYMALGCVPVIVQDSVYQPYEDLLPYHTFAIRLPKSRLGSIVNVLKAVPDKEYIELRHGMRKYWPAFVWHPGAGGQAYNYTIASLQQRLNNLAGVHF